MSSVKPSFFTKYYAFLFVLILAFSFFTRVYRLAEPPTYYFDEVYHAATAKLMLHNDVRDFEWWNPAPEPNTSIEWTHPPVAKYYHTLGMMIFGENAFGWRFSSVIFGVLVVYLTGYLTRLLFKSDSLSLLAALIVSLDGLILTQSRIAMNDIHMTAMLLLALILYVKHRDMSNAERNPEKQLTNKYLWLTGLVIGIALGTKWSAFYILVSFAFFEIVRFVEIRNATWNKPKLFKTLCISFFKSRILAFAVIPILVYVASFWLMFAQGKSLVCWEDRIIPNQCYYEEFRLTDGGDVLWKGYVSHFTELHRQIWWYHTNLKATHTYQSRPYQWFLNLRPVWFNVQYEDGKRADIYALGNSILFWSGAFAVIYLIIDLGIRFFTASKTRTVAIEWPGLQARKTFILVSYISVWAFWHFSPRIMFFYHYTPAVPLLSIILAFYLHKLLADNNKYSKLLAFLVITGIIANFILFYPQWTGLPVSNQLKESVYFGIESWK